MHCPSEIDRHLVESDDGLLLHLRESALVPDGQAEVVRLHKVLQGLDVFVYLQNFLPLFTEVLFLRRRRHVQTFKVEIIEGQSAMNDTAEAS